VQLSLISIARTSFGLADLLSSKGEDIMVFIDINADAGESFGNWQAADEAALFPYLSSVNLACGFHAGDPKSIEKSVALAAELGLAIGAHPGFRDLVGFGRRLIAVSAEEIYADVIYQVAALDGFLKIVGKKMHHVKPHGALYLAMMKDVELATTVCKAIYDFDKELPLVSLAGSGGERLKKVADKVGLRVVSEAFPDRAYLANGQLAPRHMRDSVFNEPEKIAARAVLMAKGKAFEAIDGSKIVLEADTLCIHGDNSNSALTARAIKDALHKAGIEVKAF